MLDWCGERGFDLSLIETMPLGAIDEDRTDRFLPLPRGLRRSRRALPLSRDDAIAAAACALLASRAARHPARPDLAAHRQFLRHLQPGAPHDRGHRSIPASAMTIRST